MKLLIKNSNAKFNYEILEEYIAGIVLRGYEVKSIKQSQGSLMGSYISINDANQVILRNMNVSVNDKSYLTRYSDVDLNRDKELLLHKYEIDKIKRKLNEKGLSAIPLEVTRDRNLIKVRIGICKGKKLYDKKNVIKERDIKRESDREMKKY